MYQLTDYHLVLERHDWNARKPGTMAAQASPSEAFVHHGAETDAEARGITTREQVKAAMHGIQAFHMGPERGWSDIGYHYVVFQPHGSLRHAVICEGRPVRCVPAAQLNHNTNTFAVCVFGTIDRNDPLQDSTIKALGALLSGRRADLTGAHNIKTVGGHRDVTQTDCPGNYLYDKLDTIAHAAKIGRYHK
jgi:hypothetical protein